MIHKYLYMYWRTSSTMLLALIPQIYTTTISMQNTILTMQYYKLVTG